MCIRDRHRAGPAVVPAADAAAAAAAAAASVATVATEAYTIAEHPRANNCSDVEIPPSSAYFIEDEKTAPPTFDIAITRHASDRTTRMYQMPQLRYLHKSFSVPLSVGRV